MTKLNGFKVTTGGEIKEIEFTDGKGKPIFLQIADEIGGYMEIVRPSYKDWPKDIVMVVDDNGLAKQLPENVIGELVYGTPKHGAPIVGDILFLAEGWTEDEDGYPERDFVPMTRDQTIELMTVFGDMCKAFQNYADEQAEAAGLRRDH